MAGPSDDAVYAPPGEAGAAGQGDPVAPANTSNELHLLAERAPEDAPLLERQRPRSFALRLAVTLLAAVAAAILEMIDLPGTSTPTIAVGLLVNTRLSLVTLGLTPVVTAYMLVDLAALAIPRWRKLRHGGPAASAGLTRATAAVTFAIAAVQTYSILAMRSSVSSPITLLGAIAGTFLLWMLAGVVSRYGLGSGIIWLTVASSLRLILGRLILSQAPADLTDGPGSAAPIYSFNAMVLALVVVTAATVFVQWPVANPRPQSDEPSRSVRLAIPAPLSGLAPQVAAAKLFIALPSFGVTLPWKPWDAPSLAEVAVLATLTAFLALGLGFLFHLPSRVGALLAKAGILLPAAAGSRAGGFVWSFIPLSIAYVVVLAVVHRAAPLAEFATLPFLIAWSIDVIGELRARRAHPTMTVIWREQRPYAAAAVQAVLAHHGIAAHAAGLSQRAMAQFGKRYAPIEILVPAAEAPRAARYVIAVLSSLPLAPLVADEEPVKSPKKRKAGSKKRARARKPGELIAAVAALPGAATYIALGVMAAVVSLCIVSW